MKSDEEILALVDEMARTREIYRLEMEDGSRIIKFSEDALIDFVNIIVKSVDKV